jgi:hypothetical protein
MSLNWITPTSHHRGDDRVGEKDDPLSFEFQQTLEYPCHQKIGSRVATIARSAARYRAPAPFKDELSRWDLDVCGNAKVVRQMRLRRSNKT